MKPSPCLSSALAAVLLASPVFAQPPAAKAAAPAPAPAAVATPVKLSASDRAFLSDTLATNQLEVDVSAYAAKQAHDEKVRQLAAARVNEYKDLGKLFQKANDGIVVAPTPTPQPGPNLLGKTGVDFDRTFLGMLIAYDRGLASKFDGADGPQHGAAIREMVKSSLPAIRHQEDEAKALLRTLPLR
ncbi:MAG: DUF4142 domain-containing protein [Proteobacteria bacterium]|nr:DUF4142 domain-containing protein [Pseudomonadota bacterium]